MKIIDQVEEILRTVPLTRDSDQLLTINIWSRYHSDKLVGMRDFLAVPLHNLMFLPREDTIKRIRADFQNRQGKYLPSLEIALARKIKAHFIKATYPNFTDNL